MSIEKLPRWFELSDGTLTFKATLYEAMKYSQSIETEGGYATIRMLNGGLIKQQNWSKKKITISGTGGIPFGMTDLNYRLPITLKCGAPEIMKRPANAFVLPNHRVDTGYEPYVLKYVEGLWVGLSAAGVAEEYACFYYPTFTCFFAPPTRGFEWDASEPSSWSLVGEEI